MGESSVRMMVGEEYPSPFSFCQSFNPAGTPRSHWAPFCFHHLRIGFPKLSFCLLESASYRGFFFFFSGFYIDMVGPGSPGLETDGRSYAKVLFVLCPSWVHQLFL